MSISRAQSRRRAAMFAALSSVSSKQVTSEHRDTLAGGNRFELSIGVSALVDGKEVEWQGAGSLEVRPDTTSTRTIRCDAAEIAAWLVDQLPKSRRDKVLAELVEAYQEHKKLEAQENTLILARDAVGRLCYAETSPRRGALIYTPHKPK